MIVGRDPWTRRASRKCRGDRKAPEIARTCRVFGEGNLGSHCFRVVQRCFGWQSLTTKHFSLFAETCDCFGAYRAGAARRRACHAVVQPKADATRCAAHPPSKVRRGKAGRRLQLRRHLVGRSNKLSIKLFVALGRGIPRKIARHRPFHQLRPNIAVAVNFPCAFDRIPKSVA